MTKMIDESEFQSLVETYGADPKRWPAQIRPGAEAFMQAVPKKAEIYLRAAGKLDTVLDQFNLNPGTDLLKARIFNEVSRSAAPVRAQPLAAANSGRSFGLKAIAATVLVSFTLGFTGAQMFTDLPSLPDADSSLQQASLSSTEEWQEAALGFGVTDIYEWVEDDSANLFQ